MDKYLSIFDFKSNLRYFIFLIVFLLTEGLIHHFYYLISASINFLEFRNQSGHNKLIWDENGFVEILQAILLLLSIIFFFKYLKNSSNKTVKLNKYINYFYLIALLYYFFEEISWGQHVFGWETPDFFTKINSQNETNIHNIIHNMKRSNINLESNFNWQLKCQVNNKRSNQQVPKPTKL